MHVLLGKIIAKYTYRIFATFQPSLICDECRKMPMGSTAHSGGLQYLAAGNSAVSCGPSCSLYLWETFEIQLIPLNDVQTATQRTCYCSTYSSDERTRRTRCLLWQIPADNFFYRNKNSISVLHYFTNACRKLMSLFPLYGFLSRIIVCFLYCELKCACIFFYFFLYLKMHQNKFGGSAPLEGEEGQEGEKKWGGGRWQEVEDWTYNVKPECDVKYAVSKVVTHEVITDHKSRQPVSFQLHVPTADRSRVGSEGKTRSKSLSWSAHWRQIGWALASKSNFAAVSESCIRVILSLNLKNQLSWQKNIKYWTFNKKNWLFCW